MTDIFEGPNREIRMRFSHVEVRAVGMIDYPDATGLAMDESGEISTTSGRVLAHLRDVLLVHEDGVSQWPDGIYEVTNNSMERVGELVEQIALELAELPESHLVPVDASELASS